MTKIKDYPTHEGWDNNIPWEYIEQVATVEFPEKFKGVTEETYKFIADDENRQAVIESALKKLKQIDPDNASYERAEILADILRSFAKILTTDLAKMRDMK